MPVQWITHNGKQILFSDYSGLKGSDYNDAVKSSAEMLKSASDKTLVLVDVRGAMIDATAALYAKSLGEVFAEKTEKIALVGVSGMKEMLLEAYNHFTGHADQQKIFQSLDEAKDWLVQ